MQLESVHHLDQLKVEIRKLTSRHEDDRNRAQVLAKTLETLARESHQIASEERVLKSLEFVEWKRRFSEVHKAHHQTFNWMLEDSKDSSIQHPHFKRWLQCQNGIYWIGGKPGSGKSTLMKFLTENQAVNEHLQDWAGPSAKLIMVSWFFWAAGSPMQRSKEGLFQSLLFQVLRRCTWLIPIVCERRWQDENEYDGKSDPWSLDELEDAFSILVQQPLPGSRFCMFIDGLDEYEGLPDEIIDRLKLLAKSDSIKLCVSSRPSTAFREGFAIGKCDGSILLQHHTKGDIERFVRDILEKNSKFTNAEQKDKRYGVFIQEVIERAKGVFLWVQLVVNDILRGLGEQNKLEDLQDKLNAMPGSLKKYFKQMFDRIDSAHRTESAKVFLLAAHAVQPLSVECYRYLEKEHRDPGYTYGASVAPMTPARLQSLYEDVRNRINFLCKDLLEVNEIHTDAIFGYQVDFLHRTVRDFLMTKDIHEELVQRATDDNTTDWDAHRALCHVELARAKQLPLGRGIQHHLNVLFTLVDALLFYVHEVEIEQKLAVSKLLDELDRVVSSYANHDMVYHWTNARDPPKGLYFDEANHNCFLALAIQSRLVLYVKEKLDRYPNILFTKRGRPFLDYALRPIVVTPTKLPQAIESIDFDMVRMLLDKGANPNQKVPIYGSITVWGLFLLSCYEKRYIKNPHAKDTWFKAAEMMIRKGADKNLKLETTRRETIVSRSETDEMRSKTAKYRKVVRRGGVIEVDVPVELTTLSILTEIFGDGKIAEIDAIVPEGTGWSLRSLLPWF